MRLIDEEGENKGVVPIEEAQQYARDVGFDLVEVAPNARPPVCRVMDYGKFRYEQEKKAKQARKASKQVEVKELRLRPKTDDHHIGVKAKQARRFLEKGNKVRVRVLFRGRERYHGDIGRDMLQEFAEQLSDVSEIEQAPTHQGRSMTMMLVPSD